MFNWLHNFEPQPVLAIIGPVKIYWYGLFIVLAIISGGLVMQLLAKKRSISPEIIFDLLFWLVIGGLVGARIYDVLLEYEYYLKKPVAVFKLWQGGLAVHGAIIGCLLALFFFLRKRKLNFWSYASLTAVAAPLAQAIGRWGNYFNQELIGRPTDLPWGIPINFANRSVEFMGDQYFHPAFLYESLGNLLIFSFLFWFVSRQTNKESDKLLANNVLTVVLYLILYSVLRFSLEFIKIDRTPELFSLRWPQIISLAIIVVSSAWFYRWRNKHKTAST